jgi:hypothetical protein
LQSLDGFELQAGEPHLTCNSFIDIRAALHGRGLAAILPDFLDPGKEETAFLHVRCPAIDNRCFHYRLAWNPRLLRLNPHASRRRDSLLESLTSRMRGGSPHGATSRPSRSSGK